MHNVDWIVIAPTVIYMLLVAHAMWVKLGHYLGGEVGSMSPVE